MDYTMIYFSGTGNTKLIAQEIKKRFEDLENNVELISIEDHERLANCDLTNKVVGFGFPVYKFSYPDIFNQFFLTLNEKLNGNKYFVFSTYARFEASAFSDFTRNINNGSLIAAQGFKTPSCGISARKNVDDYEYQSVMFFEDEINFKLDGFVINIIKHVGGECMLNLKKGLFDKIKKAIVKDIEITKYPRLQIEDEKCTLCGLCAHACPDRNLLIREGLVEIKDSVGCLRCLRCMNHCPSNAITFGSLTKGDNQYTLKVRDQLFEKSVNGVREVYWAQFSDVIKRWRKNTLKYWLLNRRIRYKR